MNAAEDVPSAEALLSWYTEVPSRMLGFEGASSADPRTVTPQPPPQPERKLLCQEGLDGE